jgi:hypothetical protein
VNAEPTALTLGPGGAIRACIAAASARDLERWSALVEPTATLTAAIDGVNTTTSGIAAAARAALAATSTLTLEAGWVVVVDPCTAVVELTVDLATERAAFHIEGVTAKVELADDARIRRVSLFLLDPSFGGAIAPAASGADE